MSFRVARISDASVLAAISIEVWLGTYIRRGVSTFFAEYALSEFTAQKFAAVLSDEKEHLIVSENVDGLDGFVRLSRDKAAPVPNCSTMEISTLYVQPRHHGRGLGQSLLDLALNYAKAQGAPSVWLTTNSDNRQAISFYLRQGFQKVGTTHFRIQDQAYLNDVFTRDIPR